MTFTSFLFFKFLFIEAAIKLLLTIVQIDQFWLAAFDLILILVVLHRNCDFLLRNKKAAGHLFYFRSMKHYLFHFDVQILPFQSFQSIPTLLCIHQLILRELSNQLVYYLKINCCPKFLNMINLQYFVISLNEIQ